MLQGCASILCNGCSGVYQRRSQRSIQRSYSKGAELLCLHRLFLCGLHSCSVFASALHLPMVLYYIFITSYKSNRFVFVNPCCLFLYSFLRREFVQVKRASSIQGVSDLQNFPPWCDWVRQNSADRSHKVFNIWSFLMKNAIQVLNIDLNLFCFLYWLSEADL